MRLFTRGSRVRENGLRGYALEQSRRIRLYSWHSGLCWIIGKEACVTEMSQYREGECMARLYSSPEFRDRLAIHRQRHARSTDILIDPGCCPSITVHLKVMLAINISQSRSMAT